MMKTSELTDKEKTYLLDLARRVITAKTEGNDFSADTFFSDNLKKKYGVFVTLHKHGQLRGCIGYVEGIKRLKDAVIEMSVSAAFEDPRFPQVRNNELDDINIEISVLSPLETISDIDRITIGEHGLVIKNGLNRGLLLPQVAVEYQWNKEEFLEHACQKAGLSKNSWREPTTVIQLFSAEVFSETD